MSHVSSHVASLPFRRLRTLPTKKTLDRRLVMCVKNNNNNVNINGFPLLRTKVKGSCQLINQKQKK